MKTGHLPYGNQTDVVQAAAQLSINTTRELLKLNRIVESRMNLSHLHESQHLLKVIIHYLTEEEKEERQKILQEKRIKKYPLDHPLNKIIEKATLIDLQLNRLQASLSIEWVTDNEHDIPMLSEVVEEVKQRDDSFRSRNLPSHILHTILEGLSAHPECVARTYFTLRNGATEPIIRHYFVDPELTILCIPTGLSTLLSPIKTHLQSLFNSIIITHTKIKNEPEFTPSKLQLNTHNRLVSPTNKNKPSSVSGEILFNERAFAMPFTKVFKFDDQTELQVSPLINTLVTVKTNAPLDDIIPFIVEAKL